MAVAVIVGFGVGILSASRPKTYFDLGGRLFGIITYALPLFWVGMLMQLIFSIQLGWFPNSNHFPPNLPTPASITGLYTVDSLLSGNIS
jgi:peptide/nickel transport system permease protein